MHPLIPILQHATLHADLIVRHSGESDDVEIVRLDLHELPGDSDEEPTTAIELCDGLYTVHDREPDADLTILRRINLGQLSGTHVFPGGTGFAHWHIELRGQAPNP